MRSKLRAKEGPQSQLSLSAKASAATENSKEAVEDRETRRKTRLQATIEREHNAIVIEIQKAKLKLNS